MSENLTMKAVGLYRYLPIEAADSLVDVVVPKPSPSGRDLLVEVKAVSVNPADAKVRQPKAAVEAEPRILGWDAAGIVAEAGPACTLFKPGDEVYYAGSIARPGANSEFHLVDERIVGPKPVTLDFAEAAALPLTSITAWEALVDRLRVSPLPGGNRDKTILIIGAAGGVGSMAVQLARYLGFTVIGTASRPESSAWVTELGAAHVINHYEEFVPQLAALGFSSVDYILCCNDTDLHWANMASAIAPQGGICAIVPSVQPVNLALLHRKSVTFAWELMFTRPAFETPDMAEQHKLLARLADWIDAGHLRTTLTRRLGPMNAASLKQAHALIESGRTIGKIALDAGHPQS
ncbi:zinc-binding alcohol dehydrogenase family protein [Paenibacillus chartarius]|uniref:Zinc-type alcohol dehydrogenase-like protein n=1 Tax=Paenibacillus chartarius TaxID=747481 RepID=A0ABV6DGI3_9BACL